MWWRGEVTRADPPQVYLPGVMEPGQYIDAETVFALTAGARVWVTPVAGGGWVIVAPRPTTTPTPTGK